MTSLLRLLATLVGVALFLAAYTALLTGHWWLAAWLVLGVCGVAKGLWGHQG